MTYSAALGRINEIRERLGMDPNVRTIGTQGFDQVLATARDRFNEGPTRIITPSPDVESGGWGNNPNAVNTLSKIKTQGGNAAAPIASAGYPTPAKVHGWSPELSKMIGTASERYGVPRELITAVSRAESAFRSKIGSPAGAQGLMQLMPATAKGLGVTNVDDPWQNLAGGTKYLRQLMDRFDGDVTKVIAGYNAGPNAVAKYGGIPPYKETQTYVARVLDYAAELGWKP